MNVEVSVSRACQTDTPLLVLPWCQRPDRAGERPGPELEELDECLGSALTRAVTGGDFRGKRGETLLLYRQGASGPDRTLLVGVGPRNELRAERLREVGGRAAKQARQLGVGELSLWVSATWLDGAVDVEMAARAMVEGVVLGDWRFEELRSEPAEDDERPPVAATTVVVPKPGDEKHAALGAGVGRVLAEAQNYARELAIRPGNIVTPRYLADEARRLGKAHGLGVKVLGREELKSEGMSAVLAVAAGSDEEPCFIAVEYKGATERRAVVLVGKGVTFDSGGLSLKNPKGMESMKYDMSGAAAVLGAIRAIGQLELPVHVVALVPAVENLPSGRALKPGDVISSHSRKTIEVLNTDAEGRLILADALNYAGRYEPEALVDVATLTGACVVALGHQAVGLMGNDQGLIDEIGDAGERAGERVWQLPLWDEYREQLKSDVADIKNTGGRPAGTITAGMFLREFVGSMTWAHLDIAGTAWAERSGPYQPTGPTGVGVRLLAEWIRTRAG